MTPNPELIAEVRTWFIKAAHDIDDRKDRKVSPRDMIKSVRQKMQKSA